MNLEITSPPGRPGTSALADVLREPLEHAGQRVVTLPMMDRVHERPEGTARRNFNQHRDKMLEGRHYFISAPANEFRTPDGRLTGAEEQILLTERGYLLLVKAFRDTLAWQVQEQLVDTYFRVKEIADGDSDAVIVRRSEAVALTEIGRAALDKLSMMPTKDDLSDAVKDKASREDLAAVEARLDAKIAAVLEAQRRNAEELKPRRTPKRGGLTRREACAVNLLCFGGMDPIDMKTRIVNEDGTEVEGVAEWDHFVDKHSTRPEDGWLTARATNALLKEPTNAARDPYRGTFKEYQRRRAIWVEAQKATAAEAEKQGDLFLFSARKSQD